MNQFKSIALGLSMTVLFSWLPVRAHDEKIETNVCITVFVHGIISIQPYLSFNNVVRLKRDQINDTVYARAVELTRKDSFFFQHHAMQDMGLQKIDLDTIAPGLATTAFARAYDVIAQKAGYAHEKNIYYTFGWSGLLSRKMRTMEAQIFYRSLAELLQSYHHKGIFPTLRIVGYSHGGRVALELAVAQHLVQPGYNLTIDELILVGMPVSQSSMAKINDPLFKKVYHIYSKGDRVQPLDFFSVRGFLSSRTFKASSCFALPEKLTQINYKIFKLTCKYQKRWHGCLPSYPLTLRHLRTSYPGHVELWSFGWTPQNYRPSSPYYPLPAATFVPYIVQSAQQVPCEKRHVTVELHFYNGSILAKPTWGSNYYMLPFLSTQDMCAIRDDALQFKPECFTRKAFKEHSLNARMKAKQQKQDEWFKNDACR